jgi:hypothetical protein
MKLKVCTLLCCPGLLCAGHFVCMCIHPWSRCKVQSVGSTHHFSPGNCHLAADLDKGMVPTGAEPHVVQDNAETLPSQETWFLTTCTRNASRPFWNVPVQHTIKWARLGPKHHHHTGYTSITTTQGKHQTQGASITLAVITALLPTCEWESHGLAQNGICVGTAKCAFSGKFWPLPAASHPNFTHEMDSVTSHTGMCAPGSGWACIVSMLCTYQEGLKVGVFAHPPLAL